MIKRSQGFSWPEVPVQQYKDEPGTWVGVSRRTFFESPGAGFDVRLFRIEPNGYTSFEKHQHEHCVVVLRGSGKVRLDDQWSDVSSGDVIHIHGNNPHQFRNEGTEPFEILCIVDRERDRPQLMDMEEGVRASK